MLSITDVKKKYAISTIEQARIRRNQNIKLIAVHTERRPRLCYDDKSLKLLLEAAGIIEKNGKIYKERKNE